jgi:sarcosine oxidase, subunit alpha
MRRLDTGNMAPRELTLEFEGTPLEAREGDSVATALLAAGERVFSRSVKYHRPRAPYCMTGACSHCLMRVDGVPNVFTCCTPARPGQRVERQNAYPSVEHDLFGALDFLFPKGMDHHAMFAGVPVAEQVMAKVARQLSGLGLLPDKTAPERPEAEILRTDVLVVGGGASGLAAARALSTAGKHFLLLERDDCLGGRLTHGAPLPDDPLLSDLEGVDPGHLRLRTTVIGLFTDEGGRFVAAVGSGPQGARLLKIYAARFLIATGGHPAVYPFENNEAPGVFAGAAVSRLIRRDRLLPGERFALVGTGPELYALGRLIGTHGGQVVQIVDVQQSPPAEAGPLAVRGEPLKALGRQGVRGLTWKDASGRKGKVACDAVVVSLPASPAFELARQAGARVIFEPVAERFVVVADGDGRTSADGVFVTGALLGLCTPAQSAQSGHRAARALIGGAP